MTAASVMVQCHLEGKEPPRLFAPEAKGDKLTECIKSLVLQMTTFEASDRTSIDKVVFGLHKLIVEDGMNRQHKETLELMGKYRINYLILNALVFLGLKIFKEIKCIVKYMYIYEDIFRLKCAILQHNLYIS